MLQPQSSGPAAVAAASSQYHLHLLHHWHYHLKEVSSMESLVGALASDHKCSYSHEKLDYQQLMGYLRPPFQAQVGELGAEDVGSAAVAVAAAAAVVLVKMGFLR